MRFNNIAFPYPILDASDRSRDDYVDGAYQVSIEQSDISDEGYVVFTFNHLCSVEEIVDLIENNSVKFGVLLVASDTLRRQMFLSNDAKQEISIKINELHGRIEMIPQIVATEHIEGFSSVDLNEEYSDIAFDINPGDVLATDQPIIRFFEFNRLSFETLISVRTSDAIDPFSYQIILDSVYIYIDMGIKLRELWDELRNDVNKRPFLAMSIYKDCFLCALQEMHDDEDAMEKRWARALSKKLEEFDISLNDNPIFNDMNIVAQKLLEAESVQKLYLGRGV